MQSKFELTEKQAKFIRNCNHRWNVATGAVRSGKSYLQVVYLAPMRLLERKEKRGLKVFLGATRANIERNILEPMRDIYGESMVSDINSRNFAKVFGMRVYCIGADNVRQVAKIRGSEISYCLVDEATDINESVFNMLKSRLSLPYSVCDITTNPESPSHWFHRFLESRDSGVDIYEETYTIYDNPFLPKEFVRALEAEYAGSVWYDRYILGRWTLAEGLIYGNFQRALYDEPEESLNVSEYAISIDYGTLNPFAVMLWAKCGDTWYCPRVLYHSGRDTGIQKTDNEYLTMLKDFLGDTISREPITTVIDPSASSFIALLRQDGNFRVRKARNDVTNGLRETASAMMGGRIKIHKTCKEWLNEVQGYVWDDKATEDKPVKENDHLMDAMRYFVNTMRVNKSLESYISRF